MSQVEKDKLYDVHITGLSSDGNGVGRIEGMAVFVPQTVDGDFVRIKINNIKPRFAIGEVVELLESSAHRTDNDCPYFDKCGGCQTRHVAYPFELIKKSEIVTEAIRRIGGVENFELDEIVGGVELRYRNKAVYQADQDGRCGFFSQKSHSVIDIDDCLLCNKKDRRIVDAVMQSAVGVKNIFIRRSRTTAETVVVITSERKLKAIEPIVNAVTSADINVSGIIVRYGKNNGRISDRLIFGSSEIEDTLLDTKFKISDKSFYQVNSEMTEKLYSRALEYAMLDNDSRVLDIYCGIGTISLCAAKSAMSVTGVEIVEDAVKNAKENARLNGITNAAFYVGSAEKIVPELIRNGEAPNVVIIDPPRKGSDAATLNAILDANPQRIVYVSCNPSTLARDIRLLCEGGYSLKKASAFDMFPRTAHVETVVMLSHKKSDSVINVKVEFGEGEGKVPMDRIAERAKKYQPKERVTYKMIKEYIEAKYGFKVHTAYIAEVKRDLGLPMYDAPNEVEELKQPKKHPTVEKVEAIKDALKYFNVLNYNGVKKELWKN